MEIVRISGKSIALAESKTDPDIYVATFVICDFDANKNDVELNRDTIDDWKDTLVGKPVVGKIKMRVDGEYDFSGHNAKVIHCTDDNGKKYDSIEFDTDAFGTFTSCDVADVDGKDMIVATANIWKRFTRACSIIQDRIAEGGISTSWEVAIEKKKNVLEGGSIVKRIDKGRFLGHCLLGKDVEPAYDSSALLEVASANADQELVSALSQDILETSSDINTENDYVRKEDGMKKNKNGEAEMDTAEVESATTENETEAAAAVEAGEGELPKDNEGDTADIEDTPENGETEQEGTVTAENDVDTAANTARDLEEKIQECYRKNFGQPHGDYSYLAYMFPEQHKAWFKDSYGPQLSFTEYTYTVDAEDNVMLRDPMDIKLGATVSDVQEMSSKIVSLTEALSQANADIKNLEPYRESFEKSEAERKENEHKAAVEAMKVYAQNSHCFSESEINEGEIAEMIGALDKTGLSLVIADRVIAKNEKVEVDSAEAHTKVNKIVTSNLADDDGADIDYKKVMRDFLFN